MDALLQAIILISFDQFRDHAGTTVAARSEGRLQWSDGMLYPVLHRMEARGWIKSRWGESETGRKRKYYCLKQSGKKAMKTQRDQWRAVHAVLAGLGGAI